MTVRIKWEDDGLNTSDISDSLSWFFHLYYFESVNNAVKRLILNDFVW